MSLTKEEAIRIIELFRDGKPVPTTKEKVKLALEMALVALREKQDGNNEY